MRMCNNNILPRAKRDSYTRVYDNSCLVMILYVHALCMLVCVCKYTCTCIMTLYVHGFSL